MSDLSLSLTESSGVQIQLITRKISFGTCQVKRYIKLFRINSRISRNHSFEGVTSKKMDFLFTIIITTIII